MSKKNFSSLADLKFIFRALRHRNYRLFFGGQSISLIGTWMQQIAMSWLVYRLTDSAFLLGLVGFLGQIPALILTPLTGVIADRHNRHRLLVLTQTLSMVQAFVLSILALTHHIQVWHILLLSMFLGMVNSLDIPVRQSFVIEMIDRKEDLGNAIALNSSMFNAARLLGPALGGILIAAFGEGICFLINAFSYGAVIASLLLMRIPLRRHKRSAAPMLHELKEGFRYAFTFAPIRDILLLLGLVSLIGVPYQILMPIFAKDVLHGGPGTLGSLMAMAGCGALIGALYLAGRKTSFGLGKIIIGASILFSVSIIAFSFSRLLWFSLAVVCIAGFSLMMMMAASNTALQTIVEEDKRGRVMSLYTLSIMGMVPFGSLFAGTAAFKIGAAHTLLIGGFCCLAGTVLFMKKLSLLDQTVQDYAMRKEAICEAGLRKD